MTVLVAGAFVRPHIEGRLPDWIEPRWFTSIEEMLDLAPQAEIGWYDTYSIPDMAEAVRRSAKLKWLTSSYAGVEQMPLDVLAERNVFFTGGAGINAIAIAEFVVMGMLNFAKGYRQFEQAQQRREWLPDAPGKVELYGSKALILGYGAIGQRVEHLLSAFDVEVTKVRRKAGEGALSPDQWRARLGEFDWIILSVPATPETEKMIGADELAAMKDSAVILNVARGSVLDQDALVAALQAKQIGGAFLDVTTPEPLPSEHPLWSFPNVHITMHMSGRSQNRMFERAADRFLENLERFKNGETPQPLVDLRQGY